MTMLYLLIYLPVATLLFDWLCRSVLLRRILCIVFMVAGISTCSLLGQREFMNLDGGQWALFFVVLGTTLLFDRSHLIVVGIGELRPVPIRMGPIQPANPRNSPHSRSLNATPSRPATSRSR
ncbi:hypothetical protein N5I28_24990 [Pseudomonas mosselii]|uniref:Uncharacterized protein n=1 Tax=Pseudomonas mosselii TaxID=78327 RepID=A0ABX9B8X2_9PSED|nr:hypothetical protein [Pseudomonas mosselii]MDH1513000.1 hypothetical protein [Pseudomonas mosselii]QZP29185.1 hypothetical protein K5H97_12890 [Pseudomonas mosselii]